MAYCMEIASYPLVLQGWHSIVPKIILPAFRKMAKVNSFPGIRAMLPFLFIIISIPFSWGHGDRLLAVPTLSSPAATSITENSAVLGATVDAGDPLTARGTVYHTSSPVTTTNNPLAEGGTSLGVFSHTRTALLPQTQYFYAGYAVNADGTGMSQEGNFRTLSNSPVSAVIGFNAAPFSSTQINLY